MHAPANGIITPSLVEVVCDMHIAVPDPGHALVATGAKVIVHNSDFHVVVDVIFVVPAKEHDLVMLLEPVVGDCYPSRSTLGVDEPVMCSVQGVVIDPDVLGCNETDGI